MSSQSTKKQEPLDQALLDENRALLDKNHSLQDEIYALKDEVQALKMYLAEANELSRAISEGDLDALVITKPEGELIFTLDSADRAYRILVETMNEGTVTLACDGTIVYCNRSFAELLKIPSQLVVGTSIYQFIAPEHATTFNSFLKHNIGGEIRLQTEEGTFVPVYLSVSSLKEEESPNSWCLVFTDLTEQKKNEEIVASERLARSIIEQAAEAIVVCDMSGRITRFSNPMLKLCECDPLFQKFEDLIDLRFSEGTDAGKSIFPISSALNGTPILGVEVISEFKDCQKFHLLLNSGPLRDDSGMIMGCVLTLTDITKRKQAEEALRESEQRFRLALRNAPVSVAAQNRDLRYIWAYNQRTARPEEIIGHFDSEIFTPEEVEHITAMKRRVLDEGIELREQMWINRPSGRIFLDVTWEPMRDTMSRVTGVASATVDLTPIKLAEEALRESEERYRTFFNIPAVGTVEVELTGRLIEVNDRYCQITGYSREELIGKNVLELSHPDDRERGREMLSKHMSGKAQKFDVEKRYVRKDGRMIWVQVTTAMVRDKEGRSLRLIGVVQDITNRKKAEETLKKAHEILEEKVKERTVELEKAYNSLKRNEKSLAEAQEMAHLGNWEWNIITDEFYGSDEAYRIFWISPKERKINYNSFLNYVHPDDREYVDKATKEILEGKKLDLEYRIISDSGEERIIHTQNEVIFDIKNTPVLMRGIVQDITERKRMETMLELLARLPQENPNPVIRLSRELIINYANPAAQVLLTDWGSAIGKKAPSTITELANKALEDNIRRKIEHKYADHTYLINLVTFPQDGYVNIYANDITERKVAEEALAKIDEARIKEIHHRIKNNLQVISSLLDLEAEKFTDLKVLNSFKESQNRVASMALIHEELYKGKEPENLDFTAYLRRLTANLLNSHSPKSDGINLKLNFEEIYLDMDTAIPLGIIVNELISNSFKHAFLNEKTREISVTLQKMENFTTNRESFELENSCRENFFYLLRVADNGKGIPKEIDFQTADSLGLQLVNILVDQIDGCIELKRQQGTEFTILFSDAAR